MGTKRKKTGRGTTTRSGTGTKALLIAFERWYAGHAEGAGHEHPDAADTTAQLARLFELSGGRLGSPTVAVLEGVLAEVEADASLAARLPEVIETLEHWLDFAVETGAWPASDAQIEESAEFLEVAFDVATGLLLYLVDALDDVADVPEAQERAALEALRVPLRSAQQLVDHLRAALAPLEAAAESSVPGSMALERVLGLLSVAASPGLLPGASSRQISGMLDTAAGVTVEQAAAADAETTRLLTALEQDGLIVGLPGIGGTRLEAPAGLRAALADAVMIVADELGMLEDDSDNPHPAGTVLEVEAAVLDSKPASWRRLLVAADSDLGGLHLAVQL
ncbi:MAG: hypothetical protein Q7T71_14600, partial [Herbiconiux sp.]|nr:hypothetical protein [Herbiconiux sp.]